ncbi:uncharacterized protein [Anoplolepis gracilipes]|uniref:uncharacterized protein isoform X1 n=2 Tax=Anoplolepis gracilipes TaxID=354296 RepID=UPI003B9DDB83
MATITDLPNEVLEKILSCENINLNDIKNFKSTCQILRQINLRNQVWKEKYFQSCYTASMKYMKKETEKQKKKFAKLNFENQIKKAKQSVRELQCYVHSTSEQELWNTEDKKLEHLHFIAENSMIYYFVYDELNRIFLAEFSWLASSTLTIQYNFNFIFGCLRRYRFIYKINKFIKMPREKQILEKLFTILVQYIDPHISCSVMKTWLDDITQEFLSRFKQKYPAHSIFSTSFEQLSFLKDNNIDDHFWNTVETKQIMDELREFIYHLRGNFYDLLRRLCANLKMTVELLAIRDLAASTEQNLMVSMCHCIARRLGVRCALVQYRTRYDRMAIVWKPKYCAEKNMKERFHINESVYQIYPFAERIYDYYELHNIEVLQKVIGSFSYPSHFFDPRFFLMLRWIYDLSKKKIDAQCGIIINAI